MHDELIGEFALPGRVAVVTGAASGIGRATAVAFAQAGAELVLADIADAGLDETAAAVEALGRRAVPAVVDVADRDAVGRLAADAVDQFGRLDIWANVAGIIRYGRVVDADEADVRRILDVDLLGVFWGIAAAGRHMTKAGRGAIVNVSSAGGESPLPGIPAYGMAKAAVIHLTRTAARELGPHGVRVNAVAPGWIDTAMVAHHYTDEQGVVDPDARAAVIGERAAASPLGLTGTPRDVALAMLYLASDAARFTTGQVLRPNGGVA